MVENWIYEDLSAEELALLPAELKQRTRAHFQSLVSQATDDVEAGRVVDGPSALKRIRRKLQARQT